MLTERSFRRLDALKPPFGVICEVVTGRPGDDHKLRLSSRESAIKLAVRARIELKKTGTGRIFDQCGVGTLDKINLEFARAQQLKLPC